jgi:hypothetical protein
MDKTVKKWLIIGNWLVSPLWYVLGMFIYFIAGNLASGQTVCSGILDIVVSILLITYLIIPATIAYFSHYPFHLLAYYAVTGVLIYAIYHAYYAHKKHSKEVLMNQHQKV